MAGDIVPIELVSPDGNAYTLWGAGARTTRSGRRSSGSMKTYTDSDDVAHLVGYIRSTDDEHDLVDHPAWSTVVELQADELVPDKRHTYDLIGVPSSRPTIRLRRTSPSSRTHWRSCASSASV